MASGNETLVFDSPISQEGLVMPEVTTTEVMAVTKRQAMAKSVAVPLVSVPRDHQPRLTSAMRGLLAAAM